jgi:GDSL-like Lipase/Acylhydrolase
VLTYNFAFSGATVDSTIVKPYHPAVWSLKDQLSKFFLSYGSPKREGVPPWSSENSLFAIYIGINDILGSHRNASLISPVMEQYSTVIDQLWATGARNFLLFNIPPVDRCPQSLQLSIEEREKEKDLILAFNKRILLKHNRLKRAHKDATSFYFDTNKIYTTALEDLSSYAETSELNNVNGYCRGNVEHNDALSSFGEPCDAESYFWMDRLHPRWPIQEAMAREVADKLRGKVRTKEDKPKLGESIAASEEVGNLEKGKEEEEAPQPSKSEGEQLDSDGKTTVQHRPEDLDGDATKVEDVRVKTQDAEVSATHAAKSDNEAFNAPQRFKADEESSGAELPLYHKEFPAPLSAASSAPAFPSGEVSSVPANGEKSEDVPVPELEPGNQDLEDHDLEPENEEPQAIKYEKQKAENATRPMRWSKGHRLLEDNSISAPVSNEEQFREAQNVGVEKPLSEEAKQFLDDLKGIEEDKESSLLEEKSSSEPTEN